MCRLSCRGPGIRLSFRALSNFVMLPISGRSKTEDASIPPLRLSGKRWFRFPGCLAFSHNIVQGRLT